MSETDLLAAYLPIDRRWALATGEPLPEQGEGAVLVADIQGFTRLGEELTRRLGPWQGSEELNRQINALFTDLIAAVHAFRGSVVHLAGDALLTVFTGEPSPAARATAAAQAIQEATPRNSSLNLRVGLGKGNFYRRVLGDPLYGLHDVVSGPALRQALTAKNRASPGGVAGAVAVHPADPDPWPEHLWKDVDPDALRPWIPAQVYDRLSEGTMAFVAELGQVVPLFTRVHCAEQDLPAYVAEVQAVLNAFEARLNEVEIRDAGAVLVTFFGVPVAQGDESIRAVGAAWAIMEMGRQQGWLSAQKIGMSRGPLYAGLVGSSARLTYTLYGDERNVSAHLMEMGEPWEILASIRVCRAAKKRYLFSQVGDTPVQGRVEPVRVTRVEGERELPVQGDGPLVGRLDEQNRLKELMEQVWAGCSRIVVLSGEAGIGKSFLAAALARQWRERGGRAYLGQAQAKAQEQPYLAWSELFGRLFQLCGNDLDLPHLERLVAAASPDLLPRLPLLGDILHLPLEDNELTRSLQAHLRQASTQALVVDILRVQEGPLLLLIEDVHWLDDLSWSLVLAVARGMLDRPVMLCLTVRPTNPLPPALVELFTLSNVEEIVLGGFSPDEAVELARIRMEVDFLPDELISFLQNRGQGNPFFIEEILQALSEESFIERDEAQITVRRPLREAHLADHVHGVVLARLDRLGEPARMTLQVASVIGRVFAYPVIREVHPTLAGRDTALQQHLDQLRTVDIVMREAVSSVPSYIFKHTITHEVAYSTLLLPQRRELHERIARYYEGRYQGYLEPYYALLAYHYGEAQQPYKYAFFLERLAKLAHRQYAVDTAISAYRHLVGLLAEWAKDSPDEQNLHAAAMQALDVRWGEEPGSPDAGARERIRQARVQALLGLAGVLDLVGQRSEQKTALEQALEAAAGDEQLLARCRASLTACLASLGDADKS